MTERKKPAKDKFVETALLLFAERGFAGVSLSDLAKELGLTKQSIIYHFKTKEALYGEVLLGLSNRFEAILDDVLAAAREGDAKWRLFIDALFDHMENAPEDSRLIMRELLDNSDRAQVGNRWYLKRFLDESVGLIANTSAWKGRSLDEQTAAVYQTVGAINYLAVSDVTLTAIWGEDRLKGMKHVFRDTLVSRGWSPSGF